MNNIGLDHTPHETRYTTISKLTAKKVDDRVLRSIVGHTGKGIAEKVYTEIDLEVKLEAINLI